MKMTMRTIDHLFEFTIPFVTIGMSVILQHTLGGYHGRNGVLGTMAVTALPEGGFIVTRS